MARTHGRKGRPWVRISRQVIAHAIEHGTPCPRCGKPLDPAGTWPPRHPLSPSVDHRVPLSVDPSRAHDPSNLRAMHYGCNASRGARLDDDSTRHDTVKRSW
jgi:5-methylcytosine-specific restriction endonuclease McrA